MKIVAILLAVVLAIPVVGIDFNFADRMKEVKTVDTGTLVFPLGTKLEIRAYGEPSGYNITWIGEKHAYKPEKMPYYIGVGIKNGKHVIIFAPYVKNVSIKAYYPKKSVDKTSSYDFLIITPSEFYNEFKKLADFKEKHGIKTKITSVDEIYASSNGRDKAEKIKYFIKKEVEEDGIKYVLLAGSIYKLPIRYVMYHERWRNKYYNFSVPTDLYYADLYRYENGKVVFSSWDTNNNGIYGEIYYGCKGVNDTIDLYPDVYIGRLACDNKWEARNAVNKITGYESHPGEWFKRLLLVGGDTFPGWGVIEGEYMNDYIANMMSDFTPIRMWASDGTINPINVERNLEKGAGFLYYSGHGFPYGWATHRPDDKNWTGRYFTPYIAALFNGYKLPIIFFDACLTAKLDFNTTDLIQDGVPIPIKMKFPCFAWYFIAHAGGGAIATIGSTRVAFTGVGKNGPYSGASYLAMCFFSSYLENRSRKLGEVFAEAQDKYINHLWDRWTLQEFILLGDPTLQIGGYKT